MPNCSYSKVALKTGTHRQEQVNILSLCQYLLIKVYTIELIIEATQGSILSHEIFLVFYMQVLSDIEFTLLGGGN